MLLEVIVSAGLLTALLVVVRQVLVRLHTQAKIVERRIVAQQTLENLLEEYTVRPWQEIQSETIRELTPPDWVRGKLPEVEVTGRVTEESDPAMAKRVMLEISWQEPSAARRRPLSLTTWIYGPAEDAP